MTASLYRRLVDLPPGLLPLWPHERTTDDVIALGVEPLDLADSILVASRVRDLRVFVAVLSEGQAIELGALPDGQHARKLVARLERLASTTSIRQRSANLSQDGPLAGKAAVVVCLWDGRIRSDVLPRARSRRDKRITLDDDVMTWVETEAQRRGESQSAVVQDALRAEMAR